MKLHTQVKNPETTLSPPVSEDSQAVCPPDKCHHCDLLTEELRVSKSRCEDLTRLQHQLEEQVTALEAQLQQSHTQENDLNNKIKYLQEKLNQTHITSRKLDSCVTNATNINEIPLVTVAPEQAQVPDSDGSETLASMGSTSAQEMLEQCQCKLKELENENKLLQVCMPFYFHTLIFALRFGSLPAPHEFVCHFNITAVNYFTTLLSIILLIGPHHLS